LAGEKSQNSKLFCQTFFCFADKIKKKFEKFFLPMRIHKSWSSSSDFWENSNYFVIGSQLNFLFLLSRVHMCSLSFDNEEEMRYCHENSQPFCANFFRKFFLYPQGSSKIFGTNLASLTFNSLLLRKTIASEILLLEIQLNFQGNLKNFFTKKCFDLSETAISKFLL